jgi:hypothetical protein
VLVNPDYGVWDMADLYFAPFHIILAVWAGNGAVLLEQL